MDCGRYYQPHIPVPTLSNANGILDFEENGSLVDLVDFGTVTFTGAVAKAAGGQSVGLTDATIIEIEENGIPLLIPHTNASLHALYVLAVHLLKHPNTMLGETDLNVGNQTTLIFRISFKTDIYPAYRPCSATRKEADIPRVRIK